MDGDDGFELEFFNDLFEGFYACVSGDVNGIEPLDSELNTIKILLN